jgi:hypothetical protein
MVIQLQHLSEAAYLGYCEEPVSCYMPVGTPELTASVPYSVVEHTSWRALFHYLNHGALLQSRHSLKGDVDELHTSLQHAASIKFRQAHTSCSLQTDVWTAGAGSLSFTGGNMSWIEDNDGEWVFHTDFAFFQPLLERHTGVSPDIWLPYPAPVLADS